MPIPAQPNQGPGAIVIIALAGFLVIVLVVFLVIFLKYFNLWLRSFLTRAGISFVHLIAMSLRRVDPRVIVDSMIMAVQSGVAHDQNITTRALEAHYLAGGNVRRVIEALVAARNKRVELTFHEAAAIDLAGRDVLQAAETGMRPGQVISAQSVIYPPGSVVVDGQTVQAVSAGDPIPAGWQVEIVEMRDGIAIVRPVDERAGG